MIEGQPQPRSGEAYGMPKPQQPEASVLDDNEIVSQALHYKNNKLQGDALEIWTALTGTLQQISTSTAERWVQEFNATSPTDRGAGTYDHSQSLEQRKDVTVSRQTVSGFPFSITLHKNGEVTLASELA